MRQNPTAPPPGAVTLTIAEVDGLCAVLDFTSGLLVGVDFDGATVLDETSAWLRDRSHHGDQAGAP